MNKKLFILIIFLSIVCLAQTYIFSISDKRSVVDTFIILNAKLIGKTPKFLLVKNRFFLEVSQLDRKTGRTKIFRVRLRDDGTVAIEGDLAPKEAFVILCQLTTKIKGYCEYEGVVP